MKKTYITAILLLPLLVNAQEETNPCENLYSNVTYALAHTKKALKVTGFDHQVYYAKKALSMFDESKKDIELCNCKSVEDQSFDAILNLNKAVDPIDWYAGRFYSKKALEEIDALITILDNCSSDSYAESADIVSNDTQLSSDDGQDIEAAHLQYNSYLDELNTSIEKLLLQLEKDFTTEEEGDVIQRKFYRERTKKLLKSAILQIEDVNE